jgi:hypothetical protein
MFVEAAASEVAALPRLRFALVHANRPAHYVSMDMAFPVVVWLLLKIRGPGTLLAKPKTAGL